jgi:2',3'-cyclic-nucleotide 2'-phosphodiesterase
LLQDNSAELFNDEPVHPLMRTLNDLKYDVFVLGNHEFNFEKTFLERNIKAFKGAVLASNVIKKSDNEGKIKEVDLEYRN